MSTPSRVIPITPLAVEPAQRIHARRASGFFTRWRLALVLLTQLVFYGVPWLTIDGRQAVLFDLAHQRFYFFRTLLLPQDLIYLTGLLIASAMLLFLVTVVVGRVWCGFACPQTVYTEMFMAIERRMEGDRSTRLRLDQAGWGPHKIARRGGKHLAWALLALWTGFSFVGWFTPIRELVHHLPTLSMGPWNTFWILFYASITYLHAGVLRERICQHACPYGRFQSAMLDRDTLVVTYDQTRGEPRGRHRSAAARTSVAEAGAAAPAAAQGDCIDCTLCVQVCPTGIDIRQGLQSACISCGVCIDACNSIMDKIQAPRGLIRFSPLAETVTTQRVPATAAPAPTIAPAPRPPGLPPAPAKISPWRKPRVAVYGGVIVAVLALMAVGLAQRPELRVDVQRDRGVMSRYTPQGDLENLYRLQIRSASLSDQPLQIEVTTDAATPGTGLTLAHARADPVLPAAGTLYLPVSVRLSAQAAQALRGQTVPVRFEVVGEHAARAVLAHSTFRVPR